MTMAKLTSGVEFVPSVVAARVMEATPVIMHFIRSSLKERPEFNSSVPQIRVMSFIEKHPGCSLTSLSEFLGIAGATASTMIDRLVKNGLVARDTDPLKRRNLTLHLTVKGRKELGCAKKLAIDELTEKMSGLSVGQLQQIEECMTLLQNTFSSVYDDLEQQVKI